MTRLDPVEQTRSAATTTRLQPRHAGIVFALAVGALCMAAALVLPGLSAMIIAVVLGIAVNTTGLTRFRVVADLGWSSKTILRAGVVLLGFQLTVNSIVDLGLEVVILVVACSGLTFAVTLVLGRLLKVSRSSRYLIATGVSICGASAIAAMSAVVQRSAPEDDGVASETAESIAVITLLGTAFMFALPVIGSAMLNLPQRSLGLWIGLSVHEVAQVVAAAGAVGATALAAATVTKLTRVLLLAPLVTVVSIIENRRRARDDEHGEQSARRKRPPIVPLFVVGFIAAAILRNLLPIPPLALDVLSHASTLFLTAAMFAIGTSVNIRRLVRTGGPLLALGVLSSVVLVSLSFLGVSFVQGT